MVAATIVRADRGMGNGGDEDAMPRDVEHAALPYAGPADLAAWLMPPLAGALAADAPAVAVLDTPERAALRAALGADADRVEFPDPAQVHGVPAFTVAVRWARLGRRISVPGARALVVSQFLGDLPSFGPSHWPRLDIALDVAIAGLPMTVLCPCRLDAPALGRVRAAHPMEITATGPLRNPAYRPPLEAVLDHPLPPPQDLGAPVSDERFGPDGLVGLRHRVAGLAATVLGPERVADFVLAVSELASNTLEHGPGHGRLRLWAGEPSGSVTAEVADTGRMDLPFAGIVAPPPGGARGRGLWLACELTDVLQVWSDDGGTVIRVTTGR